LLGGLMRRPQTLHIAVPRDRLGPVIVDQPAQLRIGEPRSQRRLDLFPNLRDQQRGLERVGIAVGRLIERLGGAVPLTRLQGGERAVLLGCGGLDA
jgi:hypothetical protein